LSVVRAEKGFQPFSARSMCRTVIDEMCLLNLADHAFHEPVHGKLLVVGNHLAGCIDDLAALILDGAREN